MIKDEEESAGSDEEFGTTKLDFVELIPPIFTRFKANIETAAAFSVELGITEFDTLEVIEFETIVVTGTVVTEVVVAFEAIIYKVRFVCCPAPSP